MKKFITLLAFIAMIVATTVTTPAHAGEPVTGDALKALLTDTNATSEWKGKKYLSVYHADGTRELFKPPATDRATTGTWYIKSETTFCASWSGKSENCFRVEHKGGDNYVFIKTGNNEQTDMVITKQ